MDVLLARRVELIVISALAAGGPGQRELTAFARVREREREREKERYR